MLIKYKRNKKVACYDSDCFVSSPKEEYTPRPVGPFESCKNCLYPSHGFICYSKEGDCMRTDLAKFQQKKKNGSRNTTSNPI